MSIIQESAAEHAQWLEKVTLLREHIAKLCQWVEHLQRYLGPGEIAPNGPAMGAVRDARAAVEMLSEVPTESQAVTAGISSGELPPPLPLEDSEIPEDALDPTWVEARRVHDWRNYVSDHVRHLWHTFSPLQRIALAAQAKNEADSEEWD